jgi:hypothetical protein
MISMILQLISAARGTNLYDFGVDFYGLGTASGDGGLISSVRKSCFEVGISPPNQPPNRQNLVPNSLK